MQIQGHDIGVCSWSLRPKDTAELVAGVKALGLSHMQLALAPLVMLDDKRKHGELGHLRQSGIKVTSTMMNFPGEDYSTIAHIHQTGGYLADETWPLRKQLTAAAAKLSAELGAKLLTTHIGFVPPKGDAGYAMMLGRIREITGLLSREGVTLSLETGQEKAEVLRAFLEDLQTDNVAVNFDPANMILYGAGDPIQAMDVLAKYIRSVHVKDATGSAKPGEEWGEEVPFGSGQVGPRRFLAALHKIGYRGPLSIEREAGENRAEDVAKAIEALKSAM